MSGEFPEIAQAELKKPTPMAGLAKHLAILSQLLLHTTDSERPPGAEIARVASREEVVRDIRSLRREECEDFLALANLHHVVVRSLRLFYAIVAERGDDWTEWAASAMNRENARVEKALCFLESICQELEAEGCDVTVIKSLDHWPDLGSDLDLYTNSDASDVIQIMIRRFCATILPRSWGDHLANKWNFKVPELPELVEVHVGRLGQTGEQVSVARALPARATLAQLGSRRFRTASAVDRLIITTLQRMYRHFYLRLCDIVDTARLLETQTVDYADLQASATSAGIWEGVAAYLTIVSDYVRWYRGEGLNLPSAVRSDARFGADQLSFRRGLLRIPLLPHSLHLYATEFVRLALNGKPQGTLRLSLLPGLAAAAAMAYKITGTDRGIW